MRSRSGLGIVLAACLLLCLPKASADRARARALVEEGQKLSLAGRWEQALERYEKAMSSEPGYLPSYQAALPIWFRVGKLETAQRRLESLTLRCPDCAFAWYALGALYRKRGRFDLAILAYEAYLGRRPRDPDAHYGLAMALGASGDERTASALRQYLRLEKRRDRAAYRGQARRLLSEIAGADGAVPAEPEHTGRSAVELGRIEALIADGQLASAESLLNRQGGLGSRALRLRARIARARGQWFHRSGYLALAWLMAPSQGVSGPQ